MESAIRNVEGRHSAGKAIAADRDGDRLARRQRDRHRIQRYVTAARRERADIFRIELDVSGAIQNEIAVNLSGLDVPRRATEKLSRKRVGLRRLPDAGK